MMHTWLCLIGLLLGSIGGNAIGRFPAAVLARTTSEGVDLTLRIRRTAYPAGCSDPCHGKGAEPHPTGSHHRRFRRPPRSLGRSAQRERRGGIFLRGTGRYSRAAYPASGDAGPPARTVTSGPPVHRSQWVAYSGCCEHVGSSRRETNANPVNSRECTSPPRVHVSRPARGTALSRHSRARETAYHHDFYLCRQSRAHRDIGLGCGSCSFSTRLPALSRMCAPVSLASRRRLAERAGSRR